MTSAEDSADFGGGVPQGLRPAILAAEPAPDFAERGVLPPRGAACLAPQRQQEQVGVTDPGAGGTREEDGVPSPEDTHTRDF